MDWQDCVSETASDSPSNNKAPLTIEGKDSDSVAEELLDTNVAPFCLGLLYFRITIYF